MLLTVLCLQTTDHTHACLVEKRRQRQLLNFMFVIYFVVTCQLVVFLRKLVLNFKVCYGAVRKIIFVLIYLILNYVRLVYPHLCRYNL